MLWNNAGVMIPPQGSKTKQGYELQIGTNNLAPFLFTKLLTPILASTAKTSPPGAVRVVWVSSSIAEGYSPPDGVDMDNLDYKIDKNAWHKYSVSKAGNVLHSKEYAKRHAGDGIISVVCSSNDGWKRNTDQSLVAQPWKPQDRSPTTCSGMAAGNFQLVFVYAYPWRVYRTLRRAFT